MEVIYALIFGLLIVLAIAIYIYSICVMFLIYEEKDIKAGLIMFLLIFIPIVNTIIAVRVGESSPKNELKKLFSD